MFIQHDLYKNFINKSDNFNKILVDIENIDNSYFIKFMDKYKNLLDTIIVIKDNYTGKNIKIFESLRTLLEYYTYNFIPKFRISKDMVILNTLSLISYNLIYLINILK